MALCEGDSEVFERIRIAPCPQGPLSTPAWMLFSCVALRFASEESNEKLFLLSCVHDAMRIDTSKEAHAVGYCTRTHADVAHAPLLFVVVVQTNLCSSVVPVRTLRHCSVLNVWVL